MGVEGRISMMQMQPQTCPEGSITLVPVKWEGCTVKLMGVPP